MRKACTARSAKNSGPRASEKAGRNRAGSDAQKWKQPAPAGCFFMSDRPVLNEQEPPAIAPEPLLDLLDLGVADHPLPLPGVSVEEGRELCRRVGDGIHAERGRLSAGRQNVLTRCPNKTPDETGPQLPAEHWRNRLALGRCSVLSFPVMVAPTTARRRGEVESRCRRTQAKRK